MWNIAERRITNEETRRTAGNSPTVESMMEMRRCRWFSKLSPMEKSRMLGGVVSNTTTGRETAGDHSPCLHNHPKKTWFEEEKGQLREWMTVARDRSA
jgi:hypothetical protein